MYLGALHFPDDDSSRSARRLLFNRARCLFLFLFLWSLFFVLRAWRACPPPFSKGSAPSPSRTPRQGDHGATSDATSGARRRSRARFFARSRATEFCDATEFACPAPSRRFSPAREAEDRRHEPPPAAPLRIESEAGGEAALEPGRGGGGVRRGGGVFYRRSGKLNKLVYLSQSWGGNAAGYHRAVIFGNGVMTQVN